MNTKFVQSTSAAGFLKLELVLTKDIKKVTILFFSFAVFFSSLSLSLWLRTVSGWFFRLFLGGFRLFLHGFGVFLGGYGPRNSL